MLRAFSLTLLLTLSSVSLAQVKGGVQRCYLSGTYDMGYISPTTWDMIIKHFSGEGLDDFIAYHAVRLSDVPGFYFGDDSQIELLLKSRMIVLAQLLSEGGTLYDVRLIDTRSFEPFRTEKAEDIYVLFQKFGDGFSVLEELLDKVKNEVLVSKRVGPIRSQKALCNF